MDTSKTLADPVRKTKTVAATILKVEAGNNKVPRVSGRTEIRGSVTSVSRAVVTAAALGNRVAPPRLETADPLRRARLNSHRPSRPNILATCLILRVLMT